MEVSNLIKRIICKNKFPPLVGFIDSDSISRSLSRYLFAVKFIHGLVLDVGCGTCYGTSILRRLEETHVIGLDVNIDFLRYGKAVYNIDDVILAHAGFLPFKQETFDFIVCLELIEHLSKDDQYNLCKELMVTLKKNGSLLISTPNKLWFSPLGKSLNPEHKRELHPTELINILKNSGFKYLEVYGMGGENLRSFLINFLKYVIKLLLPESIIKFISQLTSTRYTEDLDPSPKYPVKKYLKDCGSISGL
jgi:2-polyprenyl-3-methyl-5-hydroxy-6-metoxy-1,4-benzoquinol methylase